MALSSVLLVAFALAAGPERILLCRPAVSGDPALARADAVASAVRALPAAYLDYGVSCESEAEASRAAARAALGHGVFSQAEGRVDGSAYTLVLLEPSREEPLARRTLVVAPGADPVEPLQVALKELDRSIPRPPPRWPTVAGWTLMGVGVAALTGGLVLAAQARDEARKADRATTPAQQVSAYQAWSRRNRQAGAAFLAGGLLAGAGLTLKLTF